MSNTPVASDSVASGKPPRFWDAPEQFLLDAGKEGELLIARVRVWLTLALLVVPIANLLWAARGAGPAEVLDHSRGWTADLRAALVAPGLEVRYRTLWV